MYGEWLKPFYNLMEYLIKINHSIITLGSTSCLLKYIIEKREYEDKIQKLYGPVAVSYNEDYLNPKIDISELDSNKLDEMTILYSSSIVVEPEGSISIEDRKNETTHSSGYRYNNNIISLFSSPELYPMIFYEFCRKLVEYSILFKYRKT